MKIKNITLVLAFIVIIGTLGLFLFTNNDKTKNKTADELIKEIPETVANGEFKNYEKLTFPYNTFDTSNWKTYRNEEFNFEIKYPEDWETRTYTKGDLNGLVDDGGVGIISKTLGENISIIVVRQPLEERKEEIRKRLIQTNKLNTLKDISVNNVSGIYAEPSSASAETTGLTSFILGDEAFIYLFLHNKPEERTFFEQILLSFRLIE